MALKDARCSANNQKTCKRIRSQKPQLAKNTGNIRAMYDCIKKAIEPVQRKISFINSSTGEILTENNEQMERCVEHYSNL